MDRRSKIIIGLFALALIAIVVTEIVKPKPLNWRPSYTSTDKIPFGCFVLYNELSVLFPNSAIRRATETPYLILEEQDTLPQSNYLFINNTVQFDEQETHALLRYVEKGNTVFVAASYFGHFLSDTLNLQVQSDYSIKEDTVRFSLTNPSFPKETFSYSRGHNKTRFTSVDTLNTTVLGYVDFKKSDYYTGATTRETAPNFVKLKFGSGAFYLHSAPQAFSNFYMLTGNETYAARTLSYLDDSALYWDDYEKSGRIIVDSPMRFVLNQASLKWGYYITIAGLLLFVVFKAKREQRIIPVMHPLENSSVEFAKTVGSLYYQHRNYTDLIDKKLNYFLEYIRSHYYMSTAALNEKTARDLAAKSGKSLTETKALVDLIIDLKSKETHTEQDLIALNKKITLFKY